MPFDPTLPAVNSQISSAELRGQLTSLKSLIAALPTSTDVTLAIETDSAALISVATLTQPISNPPTQAQVQAIQNKLNALIATLTRLYS
jgi:hypothetical protein